MIKAVFSDMDGTLLDDNRVLSTEYIEAIQELHRKDILFIPCSGRPYHSITTYFEGLPMPYVVCENGGYIAKYGKELFSHYMSMPNIEILLEYLKETLDSYGLFFATRDAMYSMNPSDIETVFGNEPTIPTSVIDDYRSLKGQIIKVIIYCDESTWLGTMNDCNRRFSDKIHATFSGYRFLEFMSANVHKGAALRRMKEHLGIESHEILCIGDNYNDIEMFQEAEFSYAMRNADDEVKKHANYVTRKDNNHMGALDIIRELCKLN